MVSCCVMHQRVCCIYLYGTVRKRHHCRKSVCTTPRISTFKFIFVFVYMALSTETPLSKKNLFARRLIKYGIVNLHTVELIRLVKSFWLLMNRKYKTQSRLLPAFVYCMAMLQTIKETKCIIITNTNTIVETVFQTKFLDFQLNLIFFFTSIFSERILTDDAISQRKTYKNFHIILRTMHKMHVTILRVFVRGWWTRD